MKSLFLKGLNLLFAVALFATINTYAMEQQEEVAEPISAQAQTDNVIERMYNAFSKQLDERFPEAPTNFYEAIVRLQSIAKLLEKSEIELCENFNATQESCIINGIEQPYHMLHPIFKHWFQSACNKTLLEHTKSIEAIDLIFDLLSKITTENNIENYKKAIESLPHVIAEYIKEEFIEMHGWKYKNKGWLTDFKPQMTFDDNENMINVEFIKDNYHVRGYYLKAIDQPIIVVINLNNGTYPYMAFNAHATLPPMLSDLLNNFFHIPLPESGVYPPLWEKPTFEQSLKNCIQENAKTLIGKIKRQIQSTFYSFSEFMDRF